MNLVSQYRLHACRVDISVSAGEKLEAKYHEAFIRYVLVLDPPPRDSGILFGADACRKAPPPVQMRD